MKGRISKAQIEKLAAFRYAIRQFVHFSDEAAHSVGLTPQQHQALLAVRGNPGKDFITIGELSERLKVRHNSAVGLVDRLVTQGYLERRISEEDKRVVRLYLTEPGLLILESLSQAHRDELQLIGPEMRRALEQLLAE